MILLLQVWIGAAVMAWHQFGGLPPLVAIPLAAYSVAFVGLWRGPRRQVARPDGVNISQAPPLRNPPPPPPTRAVRGDIRPGPPPPAPPIVRGTPPRVERCRDCLASLELAERFNSESG